jgi:hypothetical protein
MAKRLPGSTYPYNISVMGQMDYWNLHKSNQIEEDKSTNKRVIKSKSLNIKKHIERII